MSEEQIQQTASVDNSATENHSSKKTSGPGSRLRTAREARSMGVEQVAAQLRLDGNVIRAMEDDDFDALPSATFVKGYLRSYGRMLALDPEVLVNEYQVASGAQEVQLRVPAKPARDGSSINKWFWVVLILVSVLLLAWYWSKPNEQPVSTDSLTSDSSLMPTEEAINDEVFLSSDTDAGQADPVIEQLLQGLQDPVQEVVEAEQEIKPVVAEVAAEAKKQAKAEEAQVAEVVSEVAAADLVTITLIGVSDSWVSIRDARDNRVYRDMLKPGQRREVSGVAPLLVHLGFAPGVKVELDGKNYDHSAWHKSNSTARFVLPN